MLGALMLVGTVLAQSVPCQRLVLEDGRRVWVQGLPSDLQPGDRVVLDGEWRYLRNCQANVFVVSRTIDGQPDSLPPKGD